MLDHLIVSVASGDWHCIALCWVRMVSKVKGITISVIKKWKSGKVDMWKNVATRLLSGNSRQEKKGKHLHSVHPSQAWERRCHCMALYSNYKDQYCLLQHWLDSGSWHSQVKGVVRNQASMSPSGCDKSCQRSDHESTNTQKYQGSHGSHQWLHCLP